MSEYQYYEFRTINRQLSKAEQVAVNNLSSHGHTTATSFSVDYSWGNFKHDVDTVLAQYFDSAFYLTNWGTTELKFCFPKALLDLRTIQPYLVDEEEMMVGTKTVGDRLIVTFARQEEGREEWVDDSAVLSSVAGLYDQILQGDRRAFYIAWLHAADLVGEYGNYLTEETLEPPVPPDLAQLTPALQAFVDLFAIDEDLIAAAAQGQSHHEASPLALRQALTTLSHAECVDFLQRLLEGEDHITVKLKQRLGLLPTISTDSPVGTRTIGELMATRDGIQQQQAQTAAVAREAQRRAALAALAARGDAAWQEVEALIAEQKSAGYAQAAKLLAQLGMLATEQGQTYRYQQRLAAIRTKYSRRWGLMRELQNL